MVEHLDKCPLSPFVVVWFTSSYFTAPIVAETDFVQLLTITRNVFLGGNCRMLTGLNGVLLCRQTVGIITHWVKYIESF